MISKLGLRNVLRNKRRTFLSSLAIGIGLASLIFADGFLIGMRQNVIKTVTETYMGQAQIHAKGYRNNPEVENSIPNVKDVIDTLKKSIHIKSYTTRVISLGMITSPDNVKNVQVIGVNPNEDKISKLKKTIIEGNYINDSSGILIGTRLAKKLGILLGEKIVLTVPQAASDELSQELFRVSGIFKFGSKEQDGNQVFILDDKLNNMLGKMGLVHEIAIKFTNLEDSENKKLIIWKELDKLGNSNENWVDLVPGIMAALAMSDQSMGIVSVFLLVIVLLGILNTLFMSIFERMFEFGVIQALGTRKRMVFLMILSEAFWLGLFSIIVGILLSIFLMGMTNIYGIDYGGIEMGEVTLSEPIYAVMTFHQFIYYPILLLFFTFISAIYPGIHATKLTLADAMKKSP